LYEVLIGTVRSDKFPGTIAGCTAQPSILQAPHTSKFSVLQVKSLRGLISYL